VEFGVWEGVVHCDVSFPISEKLTATGTTADYNTLE